MLLITCVITQNIKRLLDHISNRNENKCIYHPYVGVELFIIHIIIVAYFHPGDICEYF